MPVWNKCMHIIVPVLVQCLHINISVIVSIVIYKTRPVRGPRPRPGGEAGRQHPLPGERVDHGEVGVDQGQRVWEGGCSMLFDLVCDFKSS